MGKARTFANEGKDAVYQKEFDDELYATAAQQNSYNLGSTHFSDQSGIANISQAGTDQRKANLKGALFTGNIGFDLQTVQLDIPTSTIDLLTDGSLSAVSLVSTDRIANLSVGTVGDLITINGAQRPGQRLTLYGIQGNTINIKNTAAATSNTILTPGAVDFTLANTEVVTLVYDITTAKWRIVGGTSTGGGGGSSGSTGTFISADLTADQTTNLTVGDHVEFDRNAPPTGADGGIVLQIGAGQADGIFELLNGKTYFMTASINPAFSAANDLEFVWYDITNATELGRRTKLDSATLSQNQPKNEIIFSPTSDVEVEVRIVSVATPANFTLIDSVYSFATIFEFSGIATAGSGTNWKIPARAKSKANVSDLTLFNVNVDGVTLIQGNRVLLTDQTTQSENGLWEVGVVSGGTAPLTRTVDFDTDVEVISETFVPIEEGTTHKNQLWHLTSNNPLTVDVSSQVWDEFGASIPGASGSNGLDASGTFIGDGRQGVITDYLSRIQAFKNCRGPQGDLGSFILIPNDGYDHGDFGGTPPPPAELNPMEALVTVGSPSGSAFGGNTTSSKSLNYGETWVANSDLGDERWQKLTYDPVGRILLCIAPFTFSVRTVGRSTTKGSSWGSAINPFSPDTPLDIIWVASLSLFVVVTNTITTNAIWTSPDGSAWTQRTTAALNAVLPATAARASTIVYSSFLGKIFAFGSNATDFHSSTDGINWIKETYDDVIGDTHFNVIATRCVWSEGQRKFLMIHTQSKTLGTYESDDMKTWTANSPVSNLSGSVPTDLIWIPAYSTWMMGGGFTISGVSPGIWAYSFDGDLWTGVPPKEMRNFETDYDESFLSSPGGATHLTFSPSFGYIFGFSASPTTQTNDYRRSSFSRTGVYFNQANTQSGDSYPDITERDFTNPR